MWATLVVLAAMVLASLLLWGAWMADGERRAAAGQRPSPNVLNDLQASVQPAGTGPGSPNAWTFIAQADVALSKLEEAAMEAPNAPRMVGGDAAGPEYSLLFIRHQPQDRDADRLADDAAERQTALNVIAVLRKSSVPTLLAQAAQTPYAAADMSWTRMHSLSPEPSPTYTRHFRRLNGACMAMALEARDRDAFVTAYEANAALVRCLRPQATFDRALIANTVDHVNLQAVLAAAAAGVPVDWYDAIAAADERQKSSIPLAHTIAGERALALDRVGRFFSDGSDNSDFDDDSINVLRRYSGTYADNKAAINLAFDEMESDSKLERWRRTPTSNSATLASAPLLAQRLYPISFAILCDFDALTLQHRGVRVVIALERFKAAKGHYPAALAELVPTFLSELPLDPYSGKPLAYRLNDPAADPEHRPYLLYSVGLDGVDDGGKDLPAAKIDPPRVTRSKILTDANFKGYDYIINSLE